VRRYFDLIITDTNEPEEFSAITAVTAAGREALGRTSLRTAPSRALRHVRELGVSFKDFRKMNRN
jgi:hypothetical protein